MTTHAEDPTAEVTDLLQLLIRNQCVNDGTIASGEEARSVDLLAQYLSGAGDHEVFEPQPGRTSLVTRIEGTDPDAPSLLLMGHTDVVPVNPDGWSRDPFGAEIVDGFVWGRGAVDMLNLTASQAVAFRRLADSGFKPKGTLIYLAVADEEAQGVWGAALAARPRARRGVRRLRAHRVRRVPGAHAQRHAPPGAGRREGHLLVEAHGAGDPRPRIAAVPHRQRAGHRRRGGAPHLVVRARDPDPRRVASVHRRPRARSRDVRRIARPRPVHGCARRDAGGDGTAVARVHAHHVRAHDRARWHQDERDP